MPLSNYSKDNFVAPEMSRFTTASIRDMSGFSDQQDFWLSNFILNTLLAVDVEEQLRQTLFNFLRRTQFAFREYELARADTLAYLSNREAIPTYLVAIAHWEVFLSNVYQAYELLAQGEKKALFQKNDGSTLQRWCTLYNRSKHVDNAINSQQLPPGSTLFMWLTNDGLRSVDGHLTFEEMADALEELGHWSDAAQDPLTMRESVLRRYPDEPPSSD